jgi:hypothetical protein
MEKLALLESQKHPSPAPFQGQTKEALKTGAKCLLSKPEIATRSAFARR